jgi:ubiquinone/menaquinone biosynthesis C-methylase UbiE
MNRHHSGVTDWGLSHISIRPRDTVLDVGCGGGRTAGKLAVLASEGKVFGIDHSKASVAAARKTNHEAIASSRVDIREASVAQLPFSEGTFDVATAVETHFWWPDLPGGMREILRVLKPGGALIIIAEIYRGASTKTAQLAEKYLPISGMRLLTPDEHRALFRDAGYRDVQIWEEPAKGWICGLGRK